MSCNEARIIEILQQGHSAPLPAGSLGIGDDCALVPVSGGAFLTSTDMLIEGEDFSLDWATPEDIGHKALAVNISDLAAMGCQPRGYLLSLALPQKDPRAFVQAFTRGLSQVASRYNCPLFGGDLSATSGPLTINIVVFGEAAGPLLCRHRCQAGDDIFVAGFLGGAAAGLHILQQQPELATCYPRLCRCQLRPEPLVEMGLKLSRSALCTGAMDISDGIASDLPRLLAPGLGAVIMGDQLPLVPGVAEYAARNKLAVTDLALRGGEDYGLLFTAPAAAARELYSLATPDCAITKIGSVTSDPGCYLMRGSQKEPLARGFDHFG